MSIVGSIISGVAGLGSSIIDNLAQRDINSQNLAFQREANAKNEVLMRESWQRDDNAVQRQVADLQAAGLSKQLAGSGASNSGAIKIDPLQNKGGYKSGIAEVLQMSQAFANNDADIAVKKATANQIRTQTRSDDIQNQLYNIQLKSASLDLMDNLLKHEERLEQFSKFGTVEPKSIPGRIYRDVLNAFSFIGDLHKFDKEVLKKDYDEDRLNFEFMSRYGYLPSKK